MTQDEKWLTNWREVMNFIESNKRRPSKYYLEERNIWNWMRHQQKLMGKGEMKKERIDAFEKFMALMEQYKRKNQHE